MPSALVRHLTYWQAARPWLADLVALLAGAALVLAFAPFALRAMAVLAPAVLFLLWASANSAREATRRGFAFGLGQFGFGLSWVYFSIHDHGGAPVPLALLITLAFVALLALFPALLGGLLHRLGQRHPMLPRLLAMPAGWVLAEWIRGWFLTGLPWLLLGHSQIDTWLGGFAPLGGSYAVSLAVASLAALLVWAVLAWRWTHALLGLTIAA
jgi:Apolipoprotein N-acyltransferase